MSLTPIELYQAHRLEFDRYQSLLLKWNEKINLTSITRPDEIVEKHFVDSLALIPWLEELLPSKNVSRGTLGALSALDVGAGAGFPGLPLKIVMPSLKLVC